MNVYSFSMLGFSFGVLLIAVLVLMKRRDETAMRFLIFSITVCGWSFPLAIWIGQQYSYETTLILEKFSHAFAVWVPITWTHFVLQFIGKKEPFRNFYLINYSIAFVLFLTLPTPLFISGLHSILGFKYFPSPGIMHHFFMLIFFTLVPYVFYQLIRAYLMSEGQTRYQLQCLVIGTILGFTGAAGTILPIYNISFPQYLLLSMPIYPLLTGAALIRYGLFDVQQIADAFQREKLAAIGIMAASLNHELRNPLFIAKGRIDSYLDGVERGIYPSEQRQKNADNVLDTASQQLARAMDIMRRFSDFARPFNRNTDKEKFLLREAFQDVLALVASEFQMQKIKLNNQAANGVSIHANRRQLEEIFFNLIINACHAMEDKGGELFIRAAQPNGKVLIEISDTGPGIPEENQRRIFEPFFSTKAEKGTGLGLYITKQLVEKNGGKISVKSKPGRGTNFTLTFPSQK